MEDTVKTLMDAAKAVGYGKIPPLQHCECFTIGAFDLIIFNSSDTGQNYDTLKEICGRYHEVKSDKKYLEGYIYLLNQLVPATGTTELPEGMKVIMDENPSKTKSLHEWYRIK